MSTITEELSFYPGGDGASNSLRMGKSRKKYYLRHRLRYSKWT